jgi:hypothetical protein
MQTFALVVTLWFPSDATLLDFEIDARLSAKECQRAAIIASYRLQQDLPKTEAQLVLVKCEANEEA